ncbi:MAG: restriction endonuclease [Candidatus Kryptoniota bacterium]
MPVPDFQSFFKPLLDIASDGSEHSVRDARDQIAQMMGISDADRAEKLASGIQTKFDNRIGWAKSYFVQARVLETTRRGYFRITDRGRELHREGLQRIDVAVLNRFPEFVEFHTAERAPTEGNGTEVLHVVSTPEETLQEAYHGIRSQLASDLIERVKANSPQFFERLVVELMVAMGYGGSIEDAGQAIGGIGDEGVDGIIKEDRLGLDVIYIQAKRWEGTVGRPEIQQFVGALHGKRAKKGVFITTGHFSDDARIYVETIDPKVILIDYKALANYMIDFNLGVTPASIYEIKRIDSDFFAEE